MTPADLHAWVVAQWQAKLDTARAATPGRWDCSFIGIHMDGSGSARIAPVPGGPAIVMGFFLNGGDPPHIAEFSPTFATAVCEAALRRLERHEPCTDSCKTHTNGGWCRGHPGNDVRWTSCPEVLDDAAPFVGQPDFPESATPMTQPNTDYVTAVTLRLVRPSDERLLWTTTLASGSCYSGVHGLHIDREGTLWGVILEWPIPAPWRLERVTADGTEIIGTSETGIDGVLVGRVRILT